jgi:hypothetical protein
MSNLNKTSLDVWDEYLSDSKKRRISDKILELDSYKELTKDEEDELNILLNIERKYLSEAQVLVNEEKNYNKLFDKYKKMLKNDERLQSIFFERVAEQLFDKPNFNDNDLKKIYMELMNEDMDVNGHEKLNKLYDEIKEDIENMDKPCNDPNCLNCRAITNDEYLMAYEELEARGYFNNMWKEEDKLVKLMTVILRLYEQAEMYETHLNMLGGLQQGGYDEYDDEDDD